MVDIELPSLDRTCGAAVTLSDWANPDGPASAGASWLSTAHAEAKAATAMSDLFIAADGLSRDTYNEEEVVEFIEAASAVAQSLPPYGIEPHVWNRIQSEASAIVTSLEKGQDGDDDEAVTSGARALRDLLRNYV